ncbi:MAG TPA: heme-binding protein [Terriglobales bacterium]|nr:heme-binding protein [Terriglobales bacterium]
MKKILLALIAATLMAAAASAQIAEKKSLTLDGARKVIAAAKAEAQKLNAPGGVIAVVDDGGNLMALERLDGTFAAGANISIGKARTAVQFKRPTRFFEELINSSGKGRTVMTALNDFTPLIGGVPIVVDNQVVGGVGVSGAASAAQDEELAIAGANSLSGPMAAAPVSHFDKDQVSAAFAKGAVLFDGQGRNYMVHASRREKPGQAEVHNNDADIIYVLEGTATFVTGGTVVDPKNIAADEIRGATIEGGETRMLKKGDVIIVPNNTPHLFKEVSNPFLYYVVKVR